MLLSPLTTLSLVSVAMAQEYTADDFIVAIVSSSRNSSVSASPSVTSATNSTPLNASIETSSSVTLNHNVTASNNNTTNRTATVTLAHHTELTPVQANGAAFVNAGAFLVLPVFALLV